MLVASFRLVLIKVHIFDGSSVCNTQADQSDLLLLHVLF